MSEDTLPTDLPIERVQKWCPSKDHIGPREFEGWMWAKGAPTPGLSRVEQDEEGRYIHYCDSCVDRAESRRRRREKLNPERDESPELKPPNRTKEDDEVPF